MLPQGLSRVNLNAAGIDVGASSHFVAVSEGCADDPVREYEAYTADLYRMAEWLRECGVTTVAMESTGVYWIVLFGVLEERGFEVLLVDPRRLRSVPGRKTDVLDCQWLQQLHTYGLLSGAFRPDAETRRLRSYLRQRAMLVEYASHHIQHMQKALTQMHIKLQHVLRNITGMTGMKIIEAIVAGERDPHRPAGFRHPRMKATENEIAESLRGHWRAEHIFELTQALELYRTYQYRIAECDREIEAQLGQVRRPKRRGDAPSDMPGRKRHPGQCAQVRRTQSPIPDDRSRPDRYRRCGGLHGAEGDQRDGNGHEQVADGEALRLVAGVESEQQGEWRQSDELAHDQKRQQGCLCASPGCQRIASLR